ncbi:MULTISPECIES: hypothetical protein [Bacillaceae]|uniref:hypothetical protein n=1 Tax=Bacillaceae TaxID=186817 RepID=UPI000B9D5288|nr:MULTISPECIES: hypothetical protein [Bacillaceae]
MMRHYDRWPPWLRRCRRIACGIIIPFCCFQGIRTLIFPTTMDVILLALLILLAAALHLEWI